VGNHAPKENTSKKESFPSIRGKEPLEHSGRDRILDFSLGEQEKKKKVRLKIKLIKKKKKKVM
jgi:hypothetical protein